MLRSYLKTALRVLLRHPAYTSINVFGLAVGIACCVLIFLYVRNELAVNAVFDDVERIYRLDSARREASMGLAITTLAPVGETLVREYPEVTDQVRMYLMTNAIRVGEDSYRKDVMMADTSVLRLFGIPLLHGDSERVFSRPRSVVITERLAQTLFGAVLAWLFQDLPFAVAGKERILAQPWDRVTFAALLGVTLVAGAGAGLYPALVLSGFKPVKALKGTLRPRPAASWLRRGLVVAQFAVAVVLLVAVARVEAVWREALPGAPFEYAFLDDQVDQAYRTERQLRGLVGGAAALAILIACLGMLGLASISVIQRTKEVGIQKVLGATAPQVALLLACDFAKPVVVAILIAAPLAYVVMSRWLEDYAYRIEVSWQVFLMAGLTALGVALLSVRYHAVRAATTDPVETLRYE